MTGVEEFVVLPLPSWPSLFWPQHWTVLADVSAQVCIKPAETAVALEIPDTVTGVDALVVVPFAERAFLIAYPSIGQCSSVVRAQE